MNLTPNSARFRLGLFWFAVLVRSLGENAVRAYALVQCSNGFREFLIGFAILWLGMTAVPALALAPLVGTIASSRFRHLSMVLATLAGLGCIAWFSIDEYRMGQTFWLGCLAVLATEAAFFNASRFAVIPEAVRLARVPLPPVVGLFTLAVAVGTGIGFYLGIHETATGKPGLALPLQLGHLGYGLALVFLMVGRFPVASPTAIAPGLIRPFLQTLRSLFRDRLGRGSLPALWVVFAIGLIVAQWLSRDNVSWFLLLLVVGGVLGSLQPNAFRTLGFAPYASTGVLVCCILSLATDNWNSTYFGIAGWLGLMLPGLLTTFAIYSPDRSRGHAWAILAAGCSLLTFAILALLVPFLHQPPAARPVLAGLATVLAGLLAILAWLAFFRPAFEFTFEILLWSNYRVRAVGPGLPLIPWKGPVIVIANHAAWFDPLWMNKILPFPAKPMMTSKFYDLPGLGWIFRQVIDAIRVEDTRARKDAPELDQAIAALDENACLVIFPEGWLRRKEEQPLRRFARGIWHILQARPNTPVVPCWIEGSWESMFSYRNGPPMKGKKIDFFHRITIAVGEPRFLPPELLNKHMATRVELMKAVMNARSLLGLPPIDPFHGPEKSDETDEVPT